MLGDLFELLWEGVVMASHDSPGVFLAYVMGGIAAAALSFALSSRFAHLWNRQIHQSASHYLWCGIAPLATLLLAIGLAGVAHLGDVADRRVRTWSESLGSQEARTRMWDAQYQALEAAGYPQPEFHVTRTLTVSDTRSKEIHARTAATIALAMFADRNPLLHRLIAQRDQTTVGRVVRDMQDFFETHRGEMYPQDREVRILQTEMAAGFAGAIPTFQSRAMIVATLLAVIAQALPILVAGMAAYRNINVGAARALPRRTLSSSRSSLASSPVRPRYRR